MQDKKELKMKAKIYMYLEDEEYKNGVIDYLEFNAPYKDATRLVNSSLDLAGLSEDEIVISDSSKLDKDELGGAELYRLVSEIRKEKNSIYKYRSFENILKGFIESKSKEEQIDFKVYCVSSTKPAAGKSLVSKAICQALSSGGEVAYLNPISGANAYGLSELILLNMKKSLTTDELRKNEDGAYIIPGFSLLQDYIDLDAKEIKEVFCTIAKQYGVKNFVVEVPGFLDKSGGSLIRLADVHVIVRDERNDDDKKELKLLHELSSNAAMTTVMHNFCKNPSKKNQLPKLRLEKSALNETFVENDYLYLRYQVALGLELRNA